MGIPEKMISKQFLVSLSTAERLDRLAAAHGTSASEIVRQAIETFDAENTEASESSELMDLVALRLKEAVKSTQDARRAVARALKCSSELRD